MSFITISRGDSILCHTSMLSSARSPLFQLRVGDRISFNYYQQDKESWIVLWRERSPPQKWSEWTRWVPYNCICSVLRVVKST
ncbi:MAG: hypothetical protein AAGD25_07430 [Cyanobacteria bacterium P01_F01_bin.150]